MTYDQWKTSGPPEGHTDCKRCDGTGLDEKSEDGIDCSACDGTGISRKCKCDECETERREREEIKEEVRAMR